MILVYFMNRFLKKISFIVILFFCNIFKYIVLYGNNVHFGKGLITKGIPNIDVWRHGIFIIGDDLQLNNGERFNMIGRQQKCNFVVMHNAELIIGNGVGISSTTIVCSIKVIVGDYVKIGGNTVIYDTDFHSLNKDFRANKLTDIPKKKPVIISKNVFIGAHSTILKGVFIGENSIVGAGSVVTKNIPPNEIWAGNPAKLIKKLDSLFL